MTQKNTAMAPDSQSTSQGDQPYQLPPAAVRFVELQERPLRHYGVEGTAVFFVNGHLVSAAQPFTNFKTSLTPPSGKRRSLKAERAPKLLWLDVAWRRVEYSPDLATGMPVGRS